MKIGKDYIGISTPFYCFDKRGRILFHKRSENCRDEIGKWDPGSGKLEFGLSLEKNVRKEVEEEYGCRGVIKDRLPAHSIIREMNNERTHWVAVPFFVKINPEKAIINEPEKMDDINWYRLEDLPSPLHTGFQQTLNQYGDKFEEKLRKLS